jgi:protein phosphatase 1 regulatory subunit 7
VPELSLVDLQNCRILEIDGLDKLPNLTSLHLAHNGITEIKNLEKNRDLDTIDLSGNPITSLAGLDGLDHLEDLWMNDCKIEDWKEVEKLTGRPQLRTVYLERNPIYKDKMYRKKIILTCPQLTQIELEKLRIWKLSRDFRNCIRAKTRYQKWKT